jgi:anti-sigma factor RsiW
VPQVDLPPSLQAGIRARLDAERPGNVTVLRQRSWSFQALAAATVLGAVISSSVVMTIEQYGQREAVASQLVAGHIRGLLAPQPFDIASSDRHTVKPWFTARLPASPQVPDLTAQGFTLLGGRVDVVGHDPVATIVYKHAAHTVSLTTLRPGQSVSEQTIAGYNVRSWSDADFTYIAVSDLPGADLATFQRVFATAAPAPEIK